MRMRRRRLIVGRVAVAAVALASVLAATASAQAQTPSSPRWPRRSRTPQGVAASGEGLHQQGPAASAQKPPYAGPVPDHRPCSTRSRPRPAERRRATAESPEAEAATKGARRRGGIRTTTAREELRRNEMFVEALQTRVNALTKDYPCRATRCRASASARSGRTR